MYTVSQVAELSGVSVRTLHHYDAIGLLRPASVGANGYRYYDEAALLRLQQILFYREIGLELAQIRDVLDDPGFDVTAALRGHRAALAARIDRMRALIETIDTTIAGLTGKGDDSMGKQLFKGFSEEKQRGYEREIRLRYGPDKVEESRRNWASYSAQQKQAIMDEGSAIYTAVVKAIQKGLAPESEDVQALLERWHQHLRHFYEPTTEILRGLGELYTTHPDFISNFAAMHPDLADYMKSGIAVYVDALEDAELRRMLDEDDRSRSDRLSG